MDFGSVPPDDWRPQVNQGIEATLGSSHRIVYPPLNNASAQFSRDAALEQPYGLSIGTQKCAFAILNIDVHARVLANRYQEIRAVTAELDVSDLGGTIDVPLHSINNIG